MVDQTRRDALDLDPQGFPPAPGLWGLAVTLALIAATAGLARLALTVMPVPEATLPMGFLVAVLVASVAFGFWTGLLAAITGFVALNFLFTEPLYSFHISRPQDVFALLVFLLVAGLAGLLAGRLHDRAEAARTRAEALSVLSHLSSDLALATTHDEVTAAALRHLGTLVAPAMLVTPQTMGNLPASALVGAERCLRRGMAEPAAAPGWPGEDYGFLPLAEDLALGHGRLSGREAPRRAQAIAALADQTRAALQRLDFAEKARAERLRAEAFATRSAVLTSVGHDLRTPLATILGAASALKELDANLPPAARTDLLTAIEEEAGRLNRPVATLLQLSRLELAAEPRRDWVDLNDIAMAAATRAQRAFAGARIEFDLAPLPMIRSDGGLMEQAIFNLIDNGLAHGAPPVRISSGLNGGLWLRVDEAGPGLPPALQDWLSSPDLHPAPGQRGLGLAVAKGIARHLGGALTATDSGLTLHLPEAA
jgi:two-component system sensor histidine kinase KdpD